MLQNESKAFSDHFSRQNAIRWEQMYCYESAIKWIILVLFPDHLWFIVLIHKYLTIYLPTVILILRVNMLHGFRHTDWASVHKFPFSLVHRRLRDVKRILTWCMLHTAEELYFGWYDWVTWIPKVKKKNLIDLTVLINRFVQVTSTISGVIPYLVNGGMARCVGQSNKTLTFEAESHEFKSFHCRLTSSHDTALLAAEKLFHWWRK